MNLSTYGLIVSMPPCIVGIAYDCPCSPSPCPHIAPKRLYAVLAAPPPCFPLRLLPKTKTSLDFSVSIYSGVILLCAQSFKILTLVSSLLDVHMLLKSSITFLYRQ